MWIPMDEVSDSYINYNDKTENSKYNNCIGSMTIYDSSDDL